MSKRITEEKQLILTFKPKTMFNKENIDKLANQIIELKNRVYELEAENRRKGNYIEKRLAEYKEDFTKQLFIETNKPLYKVGDKVSGFVVTEHKVARSFDSCGTEIKSYHNSYTIVSKTTLDGKWLSEEELTLLK